MATRVYGLRTAHLGDHDERVELIAIPQSGTSSSFAT